MKRVLTLFMMLTAVIVLAACGTSKEKTAEKDETAADQEKLLLELTINLHQWASAMIKMTSLDSILI